MRNKYIFFKVLCLPISRKSVSKFVYQSISGPNRFLPPGKAYRYGFPSLRRISFGYFVFEPVPYFQHGTFSFLDLLELYNGVRPKNQSTDSETTRIAFFSGSARSSLMSLRQWGHCINCLVSRPILLSLNFLSQSGHKTSKSNIGFPFFQDFKKR